MSKVLKEILALQERNMLKEFAQHGIISGKVYLHLNIFLLVNQRVSSGESKAIAVSAAVNEFKVCRATVYNAIKVFK